MFLSTFEIFKIGIGPSSSHTMGPMTAAHRFIGELKDACAASVDPSTLARITVTLHGSLAFTGKGHATDKAVCLGLLGEIPSELDLDIANVRLEALGANRVLRLKGDLEIAFDPELDLVFDYGPPLSGHPNGIVCRVLDALGQAVMTRCYYSIGGGFVVSEEDLGANPENETTSLEVPYPFETAAQMLAMGDLAQASIARMMRTNEEIAMRTDQVDQEIDVLWAAMSECIDRGLRQEGVLPGGLNVKRRAAALYRQLVVERKALGRLPLSDFDWLHAYAMAVNEENAAGGRIVTAPTNGAAGVMPAVLRYYLDHCAGATRSGLHDFMLTSAAIGGLIKRNASISGAEMGCQGEVGSASAMAAAGLCAALGGSNAQIENAAEIALEHHLGMTCDPIAGLVQIPCIERNGMGAAKAVSACSLALRGNGAHFMPLDNCIAAMRATGQDMSDKYKETSQGGLAVNLPEC
jgi:L-serine dehydratase